MCQHILTSCTMPCIILFSRMCCSSFMIKFCINHTVFFMANYLLISGNKVFFCWFMRYCLKYYSLPMMRLNSNFFLNGDSLEESASYLRIETLIFERLCDKVSALIYLRLNHMFKIRNFSFLNDLDFLYLQL